jgi:hypothetical protein
MLKTRQARLVDYYPQISMAALALQDTDSTRQVRERDIAM